jgi:Cytochrome c7 and related cytochrome c
VIRGQRRLTPWLLAAWLCAAGAGVVVADEPPRTAARERSARHHSITQGLDCSACHTPHGWKQLAGGNAAGGFDHARTGFPLTGRHARSACIDCHVAERKLSRGCSSCHVDVHQRKLGQQCDDCHSSTSFADVRALELHRLTRLPLSGMHALADCTACHQRQAEGRFRAVPADCYACHASDYRRTDIHPLHVGGTGTPPAAPFPRDCGQCHRTTSWAPAVIASGDLRARLAQSALARAPASHELVFSIARGAHKGAQCADCHRSESVPRAVQCTGCHAHAPASLAAQHRSVLAFDRGTTCLACHPGGAAR